MDDGDDSGEDRQHHPAIEVSLTHSMEQLRHIAYEATPRPEDLFTEQRALLRTATARIARKGLSTDTETYRRLGILVPHWKHPAQFEAILYELRDYWKNHRMAISLGRSYPFRKAREKAGNYLRKMAARAQGEEDSDDDDDDDQNEDDDEDRDGPDSCKLPSATMVRVFRLVNGNLEIPPTLFKALAMAGRIKDAFFPDEPSTWKQGPGIRGLGDMNDGNDDASTETSFNGTQTDPDSGPSSDEDDDNEDDDDDDVIAIEREEFEEGAPPQVDNQVRQAAVQFFQQMQAARPGPNGGNNNGRGHGGGSGGSAPFGGMDFNALPEVIRRMFGFGNNPAPAPQIPMEMPAAQSNLVFCPMPFMVMPMAVGQAGIGQTGMGDMMMNAMQSMMMGQMGGVNASGSDSGSSSFRGGSSSRPSRPKPLLQPSVMEIKDEDDDAAGSSLFMSRYDTGSALPRTTICSKRAHSSAMGSTSSSETSRKKAKSASSTASTMSPSSIAVSAASSSRTPLPSSSRSASRSALNVVNASGKRRETFSEYQQRRARHVEKKRYKASKK